MTKANIVDRYTAAFDAFSGNGAADAPDWLKAFRCQGLERFAQHGFPTTKLENWRFTSVRRIAEQSFALPGPDAAVDADTVMRYAYDPEAARIVFVNGRFAAAHSSVDGLPAGVTLCSLASAVDAHPDLVREHLGAKAATEESGFAALNDAFTRDGAFVHVPADVTLERDIEVLYLVTAQDPPIMVHPRTLVVVDDGAAARMVETYAGIGAAPFLTNAATEVVVGANARLDTCRVQLEPESGFHVATTHSRQGRDSRYVLTVVPFGGALTRHDVRMVLDGEGGEGTLNGLYVIRDQQHVDHNTVIEHASPHCASHEYFNGILDDRSRAVFNGRIIVRPGAQKTDSKQTNNNLLLSEDARADSQPQLEIYADDVRCTHGATLGPLDDTAAFYLRSRGLDERTARDLLTYGYGVEILEPIALEAVRTRLDGLLRERLAESAGSGGAG